MRRACGNVVCALVLGALVAALGAAPAAAQEDELSIPAPPAEGSAPPRPAATSARPARLATPGGYTAHAPSPTAAPSGSPRARLDVIPHGGGSFRLRLSDRVGITHQCTAPCTLHLSPGRYRLGVGAGGSDPREADEPEVELLNARSIAVIHYDHRMGLRSVGWTFFSMGATALALSWIGGLLSFLYIGLPLGLALWVPVLPLVFLEDSAQAEVFTVTSQARF